MTKTNNNKELALHGGEKVIRRPFLRYQAIGQEELDAARKVIESGVLSQFLGCWSDDFYGGPKVREFEQACSEYFGVKHAITVNSWTSGLVTAVGAIGIEPGDEVIVSPWTMCASATAIIHWNAIPVFADVDRATFTLDPQSVKKCITSKTRSIIVVSLYGLPPDYNALLEISKEHDLVLIEDNAECFLGEYQDKLAGTFGHFASYSFQASKHMTCGAGGMLTTNDEDLANKARRFANLGYSTVGSKKGDITKDLIQDPQFRRHVSLGFNYRMSEVSAAVALGQVERLTDLVEQRIKVAKLFDEVIVDCDYLQKQAEPPGYKNTYWTYSLVLQTDNPHTEWYRFRKQFQKNGGDNYYAAWKLGYMEPLFLNEQSREGVWQTYGTGLCPNAEYLQPRILQIKTNLEMML